MYKEILTTFLLAGFTLLPRSAQADPKLIAIGRVSGLYEDFAPQTADPLENGFPGNRLGGIGSGLAYAGGTTFIAIPDRGPNAVVYNPLVDNTNSYINRFHTFNLSLSPSDPGSPLPFTLTPMLTKTTLLSSRTPLYYGTGAAVALGSGAPALNAKHHTFYFTGRSDNFDPLQLSTNPSDGRFDPEGIRVANDGKSVFISDEYGPYVYQFDRATGRRIRVFNLPSKLAITNLNPQGDLEIANNTTGRISNKGMEGLAITPDGKTIVGIMQANLEQDKTNSLRIVTIDIKSGNVHEYAYQLTDGSGASEILAVNNHQFLVDERDGKGLGDKPLPTDKPSKAAVKKLYLIDLNGAQDVSGVSGDLSKYAIGKTQFLDVVSKLNGAGIDSLFIPSKLEGITFGQDVVIDGAIKHTLYVANDNDFLGEIADPTDPANSIVENPNQFFVFAFGDNDLPGFVPQPVRVEHEEDDD
ncbi:MAG TPA: esterase-like activity of phytase family protein [Terriglobales bacterium]|nr:esterase-like activity of phytase family protein [Terriglobales bacterium]